MSDESLGKLIDNKENAPVFYKPKEVLWLHTWLNRAAIVTVVITIISGFVGFPAIYRLFFSMDQIETTWNTGAAILAFILMVIGVLFQSIFGYFTLKALGSVLKILLELEFNVRGAK
jgi:hypothetical protein